MIYPTGPCTVAIMSANRLICLHTSTTAWNSSPPFQVTVSGSSMRPATACAQCRVGKRRCDLTANAGTCTPCARRNLPCSAGGTEPSRITQQPRSPRELPSVTSEEELQLVDLYFQFIHNQPHSLFHEATFKRNVVEGTVSKPVLLAMIGMSARLV